ncbi:MAG: DUF1840 domain-containing protein [Gammaproteobacteria bacterium]|nr:DUF1840 domain-containing protein [Gammaproteobacteria bacterium]MBU1415899.1 DUF1840 domain-containing protein [Gammaproteobacteria bacterium]
MIIFRSDAAADVMMFDDVAKRMMEIIGREFSTRGIITVEQLPEAIAKLRQAIAADRAAHAGEYDRPELEEAPGDSQRAYVGLAPRAVPLAEMFEYSLKAEKPVMWGV